MRRIVLGLDPNETRLFMLPETTAWGPATALPEIRWLRRQLYGLRFELGHGQIFRSSRPQTRFFVAVPAPGSTPDALGQDAEIFREYLRERVGWPDRVIEERVRLFEVGEPVPYPQDMAEPIGYDERGRLVLAVGSDVEGFYRGAAGRLAAAFPDDFTLRDLRDVNTEGGDLSLVRMPEGTIGLLVGHNRVARYVERRHPETRPGSPIPDAEIEEARLAYQAAFDGIETLIVGKAALRDPGLANPEIFHLDMVVAVVRTPSGVVAFVPTYDVRPTDAHSHLAIPAPDIRRFQDEYDRAARQLAKRGFRVARLPFADHPARGPVGTGRFVDSATERSGVILGKYPNHIVAAGEESPQARLQRAFWALEDAVGAWRSAPTAERWSAVRAAVASAWKQMDAAVAAPNPTFESQRRIYESFGVDVLTIPIFPSGEGGVHCLLLK